MARGPLDGIRIIELSEWVSGPYCGKLLAELGAEVTKVETPVGDPARRLGPFPQDRPDPEKSALFLPYKRRQGANFKFYRMDLNRDMPQIIELMDSFAPDYVVNFAAQSEVAPSWENPGQWK